MTGHENLLGTPSVGATPTMLPDSAEPRAALADGGSAEEAAARYPATSLPWALLAEQALAAGRIIEGYAYARVGYHRGLDALRRSGWRGTGPVPWSHRPNRGFLRSLAALGRAAGEIGEQDENLRCAQFLADCLGVALTTENALRLPPE